MVHPHSYCIVYRLKEACTVVRTDSGLSECFEGNVGLHQWSLLSPLLLTVVMDVISSEPRSGLLSCHQIAFFHLSTHFLTFSLNF